MSTTPHRLDLAGRSVLRAGFGTARLTAGDGWGEPDDRGPSRALLEHALALGIDYVDTADALGPGVSESIIGEVIGSTGRALVATKVGMLHYGPRSWGVLGRPEYLKQQAHASRLRLGVDTIDLLYLHRVDPDVPLADQVGALQELRDEGVIAAIGVSEPTRAQLDEFLTLERPAAVQSHYNVAHRANAPIVDVTAELGIPFVAYWPLIGHRLSVGQRRAVFEALDRLAAPRDLTGAQLALAWILASAPNTIPIFGTRSPSHLAADVAALDAATSDLDLVAITTAVDAALQHTDTDPHADESENDR